MKRYFNGYKWFIYNQGIVFIYVLIKVNKNIKQTKWKTWNRKTTEKLDYYKPVSNEFFKSNRQTSKINICQKKKNNNNNNKL